MLLQTNSYVVPKDRRAEHARLLRRFRQTLARLGCDQFEVYEQAGQNWSSGDTSGRFVQIMKFRDRRHQLAVQAAERNDAQAQQLIAEFCELINFPYQQQHGLFAVGFYNSVLPVGPARPGAQQPHEEAVSDGEFAETAPATEVAPPDQQTYVAAQTGAAFSGEPVPREEPPATPAVVEAVAEPQEEPAAAESAVPAAQEQPAAHEAVAAEPIAPEQPDDFRDEMEALGAALDQEPMTPAAELPEPASDLHPLDVELSDRQEEASSPTEPQDIGHATGNGEFASDNGAGPHDHLDEADTVLADELRGHDSGNGHGAFDTLLDEEFQTEPVSATAEHTDEHAVEPSSESTGSGIGAVLDGLDDADLDVALPAELIEDELEPHAPDAHPHGGHANERG